MTLPLATVNNEVYTVTKHPNAWTVTTPLLCLVQLTAPSPGSTYNIVCKQVP